MMFGGMCEKTNQTKKAMETKTEIVEKVAARYKLKVADVEPIFNELIAELVSPHIFPSPGGEVGFINDNHCTNNCKENAALMR